MAKCFNKNIQEYKDLRKEFENDLIVDAIINDYQIMTRTNSYPSVSEANQMLQDQKDIQEIRNNSITDLIYKNLISKQYISKVGNKYYANNKVPKSEKGSVGVARKNAFRANNYLKSLGFPSNILVGARKQDTYEVYINPNLNVPTLMENVDFSIENTRSIKILDHLSKIIPGVSYSVVEEADGEFLYNTLPKKARPLPYNKVKSFFYGGKAILIKGRVTPSTAIEEMLHPVVEAFNLDNPELFDNLLFEASRYSPEIVELVEKEYSDEVGFNQKDRDLEIVTKALVEHFDQETKSTPTRSWIQALLDFLRWFGDKMKSLYKGITGKNLDIKIGAIKSNTTLSDIAKMLNTKDLEFSLNPKALRPDKVRYSLTPEKKKTLKALREQGNELQKRIIDQLFEPSIEKSNVKFNDLAASKIVYDEKTKTYKNVDSDIIYKSADEIIDGKVSNRVTLEGQIGKDFTTILNNVVIGTPFQRLPKLENLPEDVAKEVYRDLDTRINAMRDDRSIFIPQVVIGDDTSKTATTIDLLRVDPYGGMQVINFRTSRFSRK